jgi:putative spermidine/putrescine transport system ATP-binding protein
MAGEALSVERVEVAFGPVKVLKGVSLEVAPGELVALLGSSGCGKTTLLRSISGFIPVQAGRILVAERDITRLPPERRGMAMVFQSYALWPHMSTAQNIAYGLRLRGARPVTQLSGGQRQRVALGRALAVNPGILLLDEPLSNLDARIRQSVRHEIKALQGQLGITAIHVTHDREEAMVLADRIAIMEAGEIVQLGPPEEVYNRPASPFVAAFMGADNEIRLRVQTDERALRIDAGEHHEAAILPFGARPGEDGVHLAGARDGEALAHFRSEAARLVGEGETVPDSLVLWGRIAQASYPGGFYRYAVEVGDRRFMVDDGRRMSPGDPVGVCLPAAALHVYPDQGNMSVSAPGSRSRTEAGEP